MNIHRIVFNIADFNSVKIVNEMNVDLSLMLTCCIKLVSCDLLIKKD